MISRKIVLVLLAVNVHFLSGSEFAKVASVIQAFLPNNPVVIEAGAHIGNDTKQMGDFWPQAQIYAFEPVSVLFNRLASNTANHANVKVFNLALGDTAGYKTIHVSQGRGDGSSSLCAPKDHLKFFPDVTFNKSEQVQVVVLDEWLKNQNIQKVDLLWFDLQGMEYQVLKSSPQLLNSVTAIYAEINMFELYENGLVYSDFRDWLESQGFIEVYKMLIHKTFGDALYVRKEVVNKTMGG